MASRAKPRRKAPITAHPVFPGIVALWFAVLLGIGSLLLPVGLFETLVGMSGIDAIVSAAAPPLGATARALIALGMGALGALAGIVVARRIAAATGAPVPEVDSVEASDTLGAFVSTGLRGQVDEEEDEEPLLFGGFEDEEDDELLKHGRADEAPVFVVPPELAADPIRDIDAAEELEEPAEPAFDPLPPQYRFSPAPIHFEEVPEENEPVVAEFAPEADHASVPAPTEDFAPEPEPEPTRFVQDPAPDYAPEPEVPALDAGPQPVAAPEPEQPSIADLAARLQDAMRRHRAMRAPSTPVADDVAHDVEAEIVETPATPAAAAQPEDFTAETPVETHFEATPEPEADWDDFLEEEHGHDWPSEPEHPEGYDLVATKGKAGIPRPFFDLDFASAEEDAEDPYAADEDLAASFELPIPREDGPRVTFSGIADDLLDDPPIEAGEEDEEDEDSSPYGSLLGMKGPYSSGSKDQPEDEHGFAHAAGDEADEATEYEFIADARDWPDEPEIEEEAGYAPAAFDNADKQEDLPAPQLIAQAVPSRPAALSREEQDKALRDALLNLQRISGAA